MKYILVDLDGTIADCSHRLHHIEKEPKDWESFFAECEEDKPIWNVIETIESLVCFCLGSKNHYEVLYVTGRPERIREETQGWLHTFDAPSGDLLMRPDGDHRPAEVVKLEQVEKAGIKPEDILCVFDDDEKVCQAWKELGVTVYKVM